MFKRIELGLTVPKKAYEQQLPSLRAELLAAQQALRNSPFPVIVLVSGVEGAGKAEVVNTLTEWLDPRGIETNVFWQASDEELARPPYWRFWRTLPPRGKIGIFFGSWYTNPIVRRATGKLKSAAFDRELQQIATFERMLSEDGAVIVKLWYHLAKKEQRRRLEKLEEHPATRWRVTRQDWKFHKRYDEFAAASKHAIHATDAANAPWHLIDSTDACHQKLETGRRLLAALRQPLSKWKNTPPRPRQRTATAQSPPPSTVLDQVDLTKKMTAAAYEKRRHKHQNLLYQLAWQAHQKNISTVAVFEGWDAAGKGGAIRRITGAVDAKLIRVVPIAAPTDEERAHHYLWRFWRHIPPAGGVTIFDRSWYGRVLVERVEGFANPEEWSRAYLEINEFERQLAESGIVLLKFWLHISPAEQLRRFKEREKVAYKRHKITDEDWRNRDKWPAYLQAVHDMITRTSTKVAPWTLIAGNDKLYARTQVLKTFCQALETAL